MADTYIDLLEIEEYADHFLAEAQALTTVARYIKVQEIIDEVAVRKMRVNTLLSQAGVQTSSLRTSRSNVHERMPEAMDLYKRFHSFVRSMPASAGVDIHAFYPGGKLGRTSDFKPADLQNRFTHMLIGFDADANKAAFAKTTWQQDITAMRDALGGAVSGRGRADTSKLMANAELRQAREEFLRFYNGTAKRLIRGELANLGRESEYKRFFKDLQVNEGSRPADDDDTGDSTGGGTTEPGTGGKPRPAPPDPTPPRPLPPEAIKPAPAASSRKRTKK